LQKKLKKLKTQNAKNPTLSRKQEMETLQTRLVGLASKHGWLAMDEQDLRASLLCQPCTDKLDDEEEDDHHEVPGCKAFCIGCCGCCPCKLCKDDDEVDQALDQLHALEEQINEDRDKLLAKYVDKGCTREVAEEKLAAKLEKAKAKVEAAKKEVETKQTQKFSQSVGMCQTAIAMPCMVGM
jgi:hypothetical protein